MHYLKAVDAAKTDEAKAVVAKMKEMPINDFFAKNGKIREDGRMVHDMLLVQVKKPEESKGPWDYLQDPESHPGRRGVPSDEGRIRLPAGEVREPVMQEIWAILGIPPQALFGQLMVGLINGAFYAMLSLGLALIFGMLNIINFAHGALYMMGAFAAYLLLEHAGIGYWPALIVAPLIVGAFGMIIERVALKQLYKLDHLYGLLLDLRPGAHPGRRFP